jgi:HK97 family phage portal protein
MAIIRSFGALQRVAVPQPTYASVSSVGVGYPASYAAMYRTQPHVRTVVDFLARNVAQLGLHVFRRVSDTDRQRLADHDLANWLTQPSPWGTRYRLFEGLMQDLGIYFNAFWLKVRLPDRISLMRLPPEEMQVEGGLFPSQYTWISGSGERREFSPSEIIHFGGYDPLNPLMGLSPLETLRRIIAEDVAAADHRRHYWHNAARIEGVIQRPKEAGRWDKTQREAFKEDWGKFMGGRNSGKTPVLEDGMTWAPTSFSAKDSELIASRKLSREEVAAAYHVPLPMVGILDHATFSNIKEQHKHLYADALGPWLVMIEEELERQLLPESRDADHVYLEFNIAEKLKGSFEEQADAILKLTGRPVMTANEGRSRLNLPSLDDPGTDELALQLNTTTPSTTAPDLPAAASAIHANFVRQAARIQKIPPDDRGKAFAERLGRWNRELADDLTPILGTDAERIAAGINRHTIALLDQGHPAFDRNPSEDPVWTR